MARWRSGSGEGRGRRYLPWGYKTIPGDPSKRSLRELEEDRRYFLAVIASYGLSPSSRRRPPEVEPYFHDLAQCNRWIAFRKYEAQRKAARQLPRAASGEG